MNEFYADTFAILALLQGDQNYLRRFRSSSFRTGWLNIGEAYYAQLVREVPPDEIAQNLAPFEERAQEPDWAALGEAAKLRLELQRPGRPVTLAVALAYVQARAAGVPLLTGHGALKNLQGVDFLEPREARRAGPRPKGG